LARVYTRGENTGQIKRASPFLPLRVERQVHLGQARIDLRVDIGFGDAVVPRPATVTYPAMLEFSAPVLKAYPRQAVVAEKFRALAAMGIGNSRRKDFFDL
jgi:hypothetical protein